MKNQAGSQKALDALLEIGVEKKAATLFVLTVSSIYRDGFIDTVSTYLNEEEIAAIELYSQDMDLNDFETGNMLIEGVKEKGGPDLKEVRGNFWEMILEVIADMNSVTKDTLLILQNNDEEEIKDKVYGLIEAKQIEYVFKDVKV